MKPKAILFLIFAFLLPACGPGNALLTDDANLDTGKDNETKKESIEKSIITIKVLNNPVGDSSETDIKIYIKGQNLRGYSYKIGSEDKKECAKGSNYTLKALGDPIEEDISKLPDGKIVLCLVGMTLEDQWQPYDEATIITWNKNTELQANIEGNEQAYLGRWVSSCNLNSIEGEESLYYKSRLVIEKNRPTTYKTTYYGTENCLDDLRLVRTVTQQVEWSLTETIDESVFFFTNTENITDVVLPFSEATASLLFGQECQSKLENAKDNLISELCPANFKDAIFSIAEIRRGDLLYVGEESKGKDGTKPSQRHSEYKKTALRKIN